jgi:hypothetical protein
MLTLYRPSLRLPPSIDRASDSELLALDADSVIESAEQQLASVLRRPQSSRGIRPAGVYNGAEPARTAVAEREVNGDEPDDCGVYNRPAAGV